MSKQVRRCESIKKRVDKGKGLSIPKTKLVSESKEGRCVFSFKTGMEQHLHSLSLAPDQENFINADHSQINLWNLDHAKSLPVYNLMDYNRQKTSDEDELIMSAKFSDRSDMFIYTTSKGHIRICDLRESSNFHQRASVEFNVLATKKGKTVTPFDRWLN